MKKQRKWVKWALIVFFVGMALLTFFSGTIRNLTLPEISTQPVTAGTISPVVVCNGTTEAGQSTQIPAACPGTVTERLVQPGAQVQSGDILLRVTYSDDGTLAAKQEQLDQQEAAYAEALLSASASSDSGAWAEYQILQNNLTDAKQRQARCQEYTEKRATLDRQLAAANDELSAAQAAYHAATDAAAQEAVQAHEALDSALRQQENAQTNYNYYAGLDPESEETLSAKAALAEASATVLECQNRCYALDNTLQALQAQYQPPVDAAQQKVDAVNRQIATLEAEYAGCTVQKECENAVLAAQSALSAFYDRQSSVKVQDEITANRLASMQAQIEQTKSEIAELEDKLGTHEIKADGDGIVETVLANDTFTEGECLVSLQGMDAYTLRCPVSFEEAAMLKLGVEARITNQTGGGSKAVLTAIEPDKADPANRKELTFTITGDSAAPDQYLSLAVALETSKHDCVVPNAAIYKDSVGSFVYVVETTSSPLGSRSKVRRVDVEEVRRDGGYTAVTGELSSQDSVVILSSAPLSDGQAVRFGG